MREKIKEWIGKIKNIGLSNGIMRNFKVFSLTFLILLAIAMSTTDITENYVTTPTATLTDLTSLTANIDNITTGNINEILYVIPGNASDIQAKIDLSNPNAGTVRLPCGTYSQTSLITLKENLTFEGSGDCSVIELSGGIAGIEATANSNNIVLRNFMVDASSFGNLNVFNFSEDTGVHSNIRFEGIYVKDSPARVVRINGTDLIFTNVRFINVSIGIGLANTAEDTNIKLLNSKITSTHNLSSSSEYGEGIDININYGYSTATIIGNTIKGFRENGIDCNAKHCIIIGNTIEMVADEERASDGINIYADDAVGQAEIIGNIITNVPNQGTGIKIGKWAAYSSVMANSINGTGGTSQGILLLSTSTGWTGHKIIGNGFENLNVGINNSMLANTNASIMANTYNKVVNPLLQQNDGTTVTENTGDLFITEDLNAEGMIIVGNVTNTSGLGRLAVRTDKDDFAIHIEEYFGSEGWQIGVTSDGSLNFWNSGSAEASLFLADNGGVRVYETLILGRGTLQSNLTMTSPDAAEWCCNVWNDGVFNCTSGACGI